MKAVISGRSGVAIISHQGNLLSLNLDAPDKLIPRQSHEIKFLLGDANDLEFVEDTNHEQLKRRLKSSYQAAYALDLMLFVLDSELSAETRSEAASELEHLLAEPAISNHLESVLYAHPLPQDADLAGAFHHSEMTQAARTIAWLQELERLQPIIARSFSAWESLPLDIFGNSEQKKDFQRLAVRLGLFRSLVQAIEQQKDVNTVLIDAGLNREISQKHNHRQILQQWLAPFRSATSTQTIRPERESAHKESAKKKGKQKKASKSYDRTQVLQNVQNTKARILEFMRKRDFARVGNLIEELLEYHQQYGGQQYAVRSLCDLAMEAKNLGLHKLQLELTQRSVGLKVDDGWSWAQYGDALLIANQLDEAMKAYENALSFGQGAVAKNGRAEVLKALGQFDRALDAYQAVIAEHPENVVAKNGRAEVLKALGQFDRALDAYQAVIAEHPLDQVARNARSCVLAALGRYGEAIEALTEFPATEEEWIGYHILGMIFLRQGKLEESLAVFHHGVNDVPWPTSREYFRTALAVASLQLNDFKQASEILAQVQTPQLQPVVNVLQFHAFGAQGNRELATDFYRRVQANPPLFSGELTEELNRQFILRQPAQRDPIWIRDQESNLLLLAA